MRGTMKDLILQGDAFKVLKDLPDGSVDLVVTSPPYYGLRDYGLGENALGNEVNPDDYVKKPFNRAEFLARIRDKLGLTESANLEWDLVESEEYLL